MRTTYNILKGSFKLMWAGAEYAYKGRHLKKSAGAQFATEKDIRSFLNPSNKGLLMDGVSLRLSERESFQNVAVYGVTGTGKSTVFVRPNILDKANSKAVIIVNDMSGDLYNDTSGYMEAKGYRVIVLNPHDLENSHRFNPFLDIQNDNETNHLAQMFVESVSGSSDKIWTAGAQRFVTFFLKCLRTKDDEFNTPHNLYYLFQSFGDDGSRLHRFVAECVAGDQLMINEWKSLISVHREGILSFIMNATTALKIFANRDICELTASNDIDLSTLRKKKTIIYVITPPQYQKMYRPLTSMYFLTLLQSCMRKIPRRGDLPVYFLYDEFGNSFIPDFDTFATTVRKYNISLMLFMQGVTQLYTTYGKEKSATILSGIATQVCFGAAEQQTAEYFSRRVGKLKTVQRARLKDPHLENHSERNLINPSEIRELPENKLLIISNNRKTALIDCVPSYKSSKFRRQMKKQPAVIRTVGNNQIEFLPL